MTLYRLAWRSLSYHMRSHLGALLGAAVATAVLVGALAVGDSVRGSLLEMALLRLGKVDLAMASNDRFFRENLAADLAAGATAREGDAALASGQAETVRAIPQAVIAPVLQLSGAAAAADASARASRVQVLGIDARFWSLAPERIDLPAIPADSVILNRALADQLRTAAGQTVVIRVEKPSQLSGDAPLAPEEDTSVALRLTVQAILGDEQFGRFSLQANQTSPYNAYLSLKELQRRVELVGRANLLLWGSRQTTGQPINVSQANELVRRTWKLEDAELDWIPLPDNRGHELRSRRVFLDWPVTEAAARLSVPGSGVLTYLVNQLRVGDRKTPYSMVTAVGQPLVPPDMREDEILINQWLADDLQAKPGDEVELTYYVVRSMRKTEEQTTRFKVRGVVPMTLPYADRTFMPDFPGLTDAENCRDWDTGFAMEMDAVREKDEKYWDEFRGTPKAFVTLAAGQKMWSNRFGNLTALRFSPGTPPATISAELQRALNPALVSLNFEPVRQQALAAGTQSQDFGQLFLGFSLFLIAAALLLMSMLFQFGIERRAGETGTLLAVGFTPGIVRRLFLFEGVGLAALGAVLGLLGGIGYARAMLWGLSTVWRDAVGTSALRYHATGLTLAVGAVAGIVVATFTLWLALRKQAQQPAHELLSETADARALKLESGGWKRSRAFGMGAAAFTGALGMGAFALLRAETNASGLFFGAGSLMLLGGLAWATAWLGALAARGAHPPSLERVNPGKAGPNALANSALPSFGALALRNSSRRRKRSLTTIGLLACGSFLIAAIGVFRLESKEGMTRRPSGTGGFALIGQSSLAVTHDLNSNTGRDHFGIDAELVEGVQFVPFRVRDGEDASCLNLNRAQRPRVLGVDPVLLQNRQAFTFAKVAPGLSVESGWLLLKQRQQDGAVPAIGDLASIQWALGKKVGDTLDYVDERGQAFKIRLVAGLANSVLQGNLVIDEAEFVSRFPSESGYRMFLIDAPFERIDPIATGLSRALQDVGFELTRSTERLAAFNAVQNTYLNTFQVLGGLGLILGSAGLAVVVLRNVLERRAELALMLALGFRARTLKGMVLTEHGALLLAGLGLGVVSALIAVLPAVLAPGSEIPYASLAITLFAVLLNGALWTWVATQLAMRGRLLDALRNE